MAPKHRSWSSSPLSLPPPPTKSWKYHFTQGCTTVQKAMSSQNLRAECRSQLVKQHAYTCWHLYTTWTHLEQVTLSLAIFRALVRNSFIQQCLQLTIIQVGHIRVLVIRLQTKCNFLIKKDDISPKIHLFFWRQRLIIHDNMKRQIEKIVQNEQNQNNFQIAVLTSLKIAVFDT
jgi:hypothetical protein